MKKAIIGILFSICLLICSSVAIADNCGSIIGNVKLPDTILHICLDKGEIKIHRNGKVELVNTDLDEAAKGFWKAIEKWYLGFKEEIIQEYKNEKIIVDVSDRGNSILNTEIKDNHNRSTLEMYSEYCDNKIKKNTKSIPTKYDLNKNYNDLVP